MEVKEFMNPKSMLTPGIAGTLVMGITNTLWLQFGLPQKWSALILSFLIIIPILKAYPAAWVEKFVYFILNGLIIFAMAFNTNFAGKSIIDVSSDQQASTVTHHAFHSEPPPKSARKFFESWM